MPRSRPGDLEPVPGTDGSGPKFAELFDIYLMSYSGDARVVAIELERAFRIEPSAARRLVAQLPVVVKRRVEPDLAAQYFDVLSKMGVQVVLLPSPQSSAPPAPEVAEAGAPDWDSEPEVSFQERPARAVPNFEPAPEVTPEPMVSLPTVRELPRLGAATVVDVVSPFETVPPPGQVADASAAPATPWSMTPPEWGVFERRDPSTTLVQPAMDDVGAQGKEPSFPPLPPPGPASAPVSEPDGSWMNPLPKPKGATRDPGSGLFMAENADDFIGAGSRTTQDLPLPVIKPLRERPPSEAPMELPTVPSSFPPPARLPAPPALPTLAAPTPPRPPVPAPGAMAIRPSIPPPVPLSARMPTMSRRPPPVFDTSSEEPSVLRLEFDKVPPLPSVSIAPRQLEVDPGALASLPRIELQGARAAPPASATGARTPAPTPAQAPLETELDSLPPLQAPRAPTPAPAPKAPSLAGVAAPKAPSLAGVAAPAVGKGGAGAPPVPAAAPTRPGASGARERLGNLRLPTIPEGVRRAAYGIGLIGCAVAIFAFGMRVDSSILYGNASVPAVLLHAFGMYAVGAGILGMFRS